MQSCLLPQQTSAPPWGSFVFYGAPPFSCGQNVGAQFKVILCRPLDACQTAANRIQHAPLLITMAVLCPMGLICLLWSSPRFLWSKVIICRPFDGCQTAANRPQHRFLYFTLADLCPMGLICLLWSSLLFLWFQNIVCRPLMCVKLLQIVCSMPSCLLL